MTSGHRDSLMSQMTVLEDLTDLEATVIDTYVNALKVSSDPETLTLIEVETTASKDFATTTETAIKAATRVVKTVSDNLDERAAWDHRVSHRAQSQETLSGEHHSDPPNKVNVASDLKPEQLCDSISQSELDDWCERAEVYAEASNIISQSNSVQLGKPPGTSQAGHVEPLQRILRGKSHPAHRQRLREGHRVAERDLLQKE